MTYNYSSLLLSIVYIIINFYSSHAGYAVGILTVLVITFISMFTI